VDVEKTQRNLTDTVILYRFLLKLFSATLLVAEENKMGYANYCGITWSYDCVGASSHLLPHFFFYLIKSG